MTHEAGIEAASIEAFDWSGKAFYPDFEMETPEYVVRIIQAYLSASGMVLVPKHPTREMVTKWRDDFMKKYSSGECENSYSVHMGLDLASAIDAAQDPFKNK